MKHNIPNQYWKCPKTGIECNFTFTRDIGWTVGFASPFGSVELMRTLRNNGIKIPFPPTPPEYDGDVKAFYNRLENILEQTV